MAVESLEICPTSCVFKDLSTKDSWTLSPRPLSANSAKALEKVDSDGMSEGFPKPQIRRKLGVVSRASIKDRVVGYP